MKVDAYKCDNISCGKIFEDYNSVIIGDKSYDLCPTCIKRLQSFVDSGFGNGLDLKNSIKDQVKEEVSGIKKRDGSIRRKILDYGIDNIRREYVEEGLSASDLALKIGVSHASMSSFLHMNNITKTKKSSLAEDSKDSDV